MRARFAMCAHKRFDAVEPDDIEAYTNRSGFPITARDHLRYDEWIAHTVHGLGLAVLRRTTRSAGALEPYFDGVLDEQCNQYQECGAFKPYLAAGKPVLNAKFEASLIPASVPATRVWGSAACCMDCRSTVGCTGPVLERATSAGAGSLA